jgi:hypothetical protein
MELLLYCLFIIITAVRELVFLVTLFGNVTVVVQLYYDDDDDDDDNNNNNNNTLCKACSCTLSCRKFLIQSPHNISFFLFGCTLPISFSNLSKILYTSLCGDQ